MAYSLDLKGSEYYTIYLRDLRTGKNENDIIDNTSGGITWSLDSKSFFYSKLDKFHRPRKIFKHILGTSVKDDKLIFEEKDDTFTCSIGLTSDEKFFIISTSDHITTEDYFFPSDASEIKPVLFKKEKKMLDIQSTLGKVISTFIPMKMRETIKYLNVKLAKLIK